MDSASLITTTEAIDPVFLFILGASLVLLLGITVVMVAFVIRFHRSRSPEPTSNADGNLPLEIVWIVLPTLLVLAMFYYGWAGYLTLRVVPKDAMDVTAFARMWSWNFKYADGKESAKLYVPVGKPVRVRLVSLDVLHGFFLPAFRVKRDVVPGKEDFVWFVASKPGSYDLFCSSYCGSGHSAMITTVEALPEHEFAEWRQGKAEGKEPPGHELLERHGCLGCHSLDGSVKVGPTLKGIWGRRENVITDGVEHQIVVDEAYLKRSIVEPGADLVRGAPPVMPSFATLPPKEIDQMVEYLRVVK